MNRPFVLLDPGHGGADPGAVQPKTGRRESDDVLRLYQRCSHYLSKSKIKVGTTRSGDTAVDLYSRPKESNRQKADLLVSLHRNSFHSSSANGVEIWVHPQAPAVDTAIAQDMLERLVTVGVQSNRGIKYGKYVVLTCKAPAVMVELGFITNDRDNQLFDSKLDGYAKAIAQSICSALGVAFVDPDTGSTSPEVNPKDLYRVQLGAFQSEEGAKQLQKELDQMGVATYLVRPSSERVEKE